LHLALRYAGVGAGDEVFCSTFTFVASANVILYQGARPVFVDSDYAGWNMDVGLLAANLARRAEDGRLPKALILVHLYGQPADIGPVAELCEQYGIFLLEDAAEALGALYRGRVPGSFGRAGVFSFNGNKIITTSGGGMVVSDDRELIDKIRFWATQARDREVYYQHSELGFNYRMSNVLAAIGRGQLEMLEERVARKRAIFARYRETLGDLPGVEFMPEAEYGRATHWLTCLTIDPEEAGIGRDFVIAELEKQNIESRPTWKPMHLQPLFQGCEIIGGAVSEALFANGLCLPSGTGMSDTDQERVITAFRSCWKL
jgi:pyridoxal phosphate-dependent aminotransferase EpsN